MTFKLQAKNIFLTYPRCSLTKDELLVFLKTFNPVKVVIGKELHADGTPHLHALLKLANRLTTRDERVFDLSGHHPNIQPCRNVTATERYVTKDDPAPVVFGDASGGDEWDLTQYENADQFLRSLPSKELARNFNNYTAFANWYFAPEETGYTPTYTDFTLPEEIQQWKSQYFDRPRPQRPKSLVVVGRSRLGKTEWARSLGKHVFQRGEWNLSEFPKYFEYVVFDDFNWSYMLDRQVLLKGFLGCQGEISLTDKYAKKKKLNVNVPSIVLMNPEEYACGFGYFCNSDWGKENIVVVNLNQSLF